MNEHIVSAFDQDLGHIDAIIAKMGGLAETQLGQATEALVKRDVDLARQVIKNDKILDELESEIDAFTIKLLALRQPVADDLRAVIVALKMAANLERIGDYAKNVAKRTITLAETQPVGNSAQSITRMGRQVQAMIKDVLDAYATRNLEQADKVRDSDADVDLMHTSLFRELLTHMMEDPKNITPCTHLLFIAKNVERIGDHVTNIAEYVHFLVSGEHLTEDRPKGDKSSSTVVPAPGEEA